MIRLFAIAMVAIATSPSFAQAKLVQIPYNAADYIGPLFESGPFRNLPNASDRRSALKMAAALTAANFCDAPRVVGGLGDKTMSWESVASADNVGRPYEIAVMFAVGWLVSISQGDRHGAVCRFANEAWR